MNRADGGQMDRGLNGLCRTAGIFSAWFGRPYGTAVRWGGWSQGFTLGYFGVLPPGELGLAGLGACFPTQAELGSGTVFRAGVSFSAPELGSVFEAGVDAVAAGAGDGDCGQGCKVEDHEFAVVGYQVADVEEVIAHGPGYEDDDE
jgi:hypothetical protein